jgi:minor extracellular serine protease Vpr
MKIHQLRSLALATLLGLALLHSASAAEGVRSYTVVLREPSVGQQIPNRLRSRGGRVDFQRAAIQADLRNLEHSVDLSQQPLKAAIEHEGAEVVGSVRHVLNAIFIRATREQVSNIERLGGVERVVRNSRFKMLLNRAGEIVRAPQAWDALGGIDNAGAGLRIGIIDSGIETTHPALVDDSLTTPPGFPKARPGDLGFTTKKIIVARSYVSLLTPDDPAFSRPDDYSPRDRVGHGTAVATIAAGRRVEAPGATITGIAPKAFLGSYKIFGSPGINDFSDTSAVIAAIDDAVIDGMDIISISFGAVAQFPFDEQGGACSDNPDVLCDPAALAAQTAAEMGVVVVASAGNAGAYGEQSFPAYSSIATPASAPAVIAVGATVNARQFVQSVQFANFNVVAIAGTGPKLQGPLNREAVDVARLGDAFGCQGFPNGSLDGRIAVIERGDCDFEFKVANAAAAGADGVVVTNIDSEDEPFAMVGLETTDIPAYMIGNSDGNTLYAQLGGAARVFVTLDPTLVAREFGFDQLAPFSSRGPSPANNIKPDLVAPGEFIYTGAQRFDPNGDTFDPTGYTSVDGTSFSAPIVAGAAALVMQRHPEFSVAEVKSALVNTAGPEIVEDGQRARVNSVGAGLLDIAVALDPIATVTPATVSFGAVEGITLPLQRTLRLRNPSSAQQTYRVTVERRDADANAAVRVQGADTVNVTLAPGAASDLTVSLEGATPLPGSYEGFLRVSSVGGGVDLVVPYFYVRGDGIAFNSFVIAGTGVVGTVNEIHPELLIFRVIDQFGEPVPALPVDFRVVNGGGRIVSADPSTDLFGIAAADTYMGPTVGFQDFEATAGGLTIPFFNAARAKPRIHGIVNGASFAAGKPVAAGSLISIFGDFLNEFPGLAGRLPLPIAFKHVSVSFDFPEEGISVPAAVSYANAGQLNVQAPWEVAGLNFALVKVRIEDSVSEVFDLDLSDYSPGIFEISIDGTQFGAITHSNGSLVTPSNPASPGETIVVYVTGTGPVETPQTTGYAAPSDRLVHTTNIPVVTIGGSQGAVYFSGLAPGYVGLYQINVTLPSSLSSGNQQLQVTSNGIASNIVLVPIM